MQLKPELTPCSTADAPPSGWKRLLRPGLQLKFTCLVVGLALAVGMIVGSVTTDHATLIVRRIQTDHCRQEAALLANKASFEYEQDLSALQVLAARSIRAKSLLFVSFMDIKGRNVAQAVNPNHQRPGKLTEGFTPEATLGQPVRLPVTDGDETYLDVTYPVQRYEVEEGQHTADATGHLVGYVRIGYSLQQTLAEVNAASDLLSGIAVLIICLTVPLAYLLVLRLLRPLDSLTQSIARFADGDLSARCKVGGMDEIGELALAYNVMADRLQQKHQEITVLNTDLEGRVLKRTKQLQELASRDPLTRLYNRRHFNEFLIRRFSEARRYRSALSCVMFDLDNFKLVNDNHGHQRGDDLLAIAAGTIEGELRSSDIAARFGGDEFIVLMPQADADQAGGLARRIMQRFSEVVALQFSECPVSISVGVACISEVLSDDPDDLVRLADMGLLEAKREGKNVIVRGGLPVA